MTEQEHIAKQAAERESNLVRHVESLMYMAKHLPKAAREFHQGLRNAGFSAHEAIDLTKVWIANLR
ncbi:MAG: hypothetical protein IT435_02590 [Phycisphaerales bacterium]|nr:hypothetical protein [Phycisphaerales bacterium]